MIKIIGIKKFNNKMLKNCNWLKIYCLSISLVFIKEINENISIRIIYQINVWMELISEKRQGD